TKDAYDHWVRGGAYVKARVSNTTATYGTQVLDLPVLASNTARLVPEYYTGVLIESNEIENLNLIAGKFTENQLSNQINSDGAELDRAVVWGAKYKFNDVVNAYYYVTDLKDLDLPVLASNTARLVPEYYTGVLIESNEIENLNLIAGKFTENQLSNQINSDGAELDRAVVWGAKYKFNDAVNASYYGTDIKDRLDRHYINTNYNYALANESTLTHDFSGYHTKWDKEANPYLYSQIGSPDDSFDNTILALSTTYNRGPHNVMVAYQQNFGNTGYDYGLGTGVGDGKQTIYMPNSYLSDFIGNDEKSAQLQYTFDFGAVNVPGLSW